MKHPSTSMCPRAALTRRQFLRVMSTVTAGLALAACQPKTPPSALPLAGNKTGDHKALVSIRAADSYDPVLIRKQVQAMFDDIGGLKDILAHGNRVAIKTNLTGGITTRGLPGIPEIDSYLTHPEVVRAVIELFRDSGAKDIFVVEAVYEPESWPAYGYTDMVKATGATLVDLNNFAPYSGFEKTPAGTDPFIYEDFPLNPVLNEVDVFVSVAKMKCHNIAGVTHSMKNLVGLAPLLPFETNPGDHMRSQLHGTGDVTRTRLPRVIIDLNRARPIHLAVIDGVWTTEAGEGPWIPAMTPIKPNLLFAGKDPVATDAVATAAQGFDPLSDYPNEPFVHGDNHLNLAAGLGLGTNRLEEIKIVGEKLTGVVKPFTPSY